MTEFLNVLSMKKIPHAEHCPMARYSTLRIGGTARLAVFPETMSQMLDTLSSASACAVDYEVIGRGSNILFPDGEFEGVLIFTTKLRTLTWEGDRMEAESGTPLVAVAAKAEELSLGGAEFAAGIPGTVGGAVLMNAGAFGGSMELIVSYVECWNAKTARLERYEVGEHDFGYRSSHYAKNPDLTILRVGFRFWRSDQNAIRALMAEYQKRRKATQPLEFPNCGSVFKNPEGDSAGRLIEVSGLKGTQIGGAMVSQKHANFIVNRGNATAADVVELISLIRQRVKENFGIDLTCELRGLGFRI